MHSTKKTDAITGRPPDSPAGDQGSEFDRFADGYDAALNKSIGFSGYDSSLFDERKIKELYGFLRPRGLTERTITFLNFGCGVGRSEKYIARYFPKAAVYSVDPSRESVEKALENNREYRTIVFQAINGHQVPFDIEFDVVLAANVFHHIPPGERIAAVKHLFQKTAEGGYLFMFEHNPFNPLTRKVVHDCPFDENAVLLSPWYAGRMLRSGGFTRRTTRFIHFFPKPLAFLTPMERLLRKLPLGAQYYCVASKKGAI